MVAGRRLVLSMVWSQLQCKNPHIVAVFARATRPKTPSCIMSPMHAEPGTCQWPGEGLQSLHGRLVVRQEHFLSIDDGDPAVVLGQRHRQQHLE